MNYTPIKGKIVSVTASQVDGLACESLLVEFEHEGQNLTKPFASPFLDPENMRMWRHVTLMAILGKKVKSSDVSLSKFASYKEDVLQKSVYIAYIDGVVMGLGKSTDNLFFPCLYGLWEEQV